MHRVRPPLARPWSPHLLLLCALALVALALLWPARSAMPGGGPVAAAWERVRATGGYHFAADIEQTTIPLATQANVGRESRQERFRIEGETDLRREAMRFSLWSQGGSVADPGSAIEVSVEQGRALARQRGQAWQEIGDMRSGLAPGGDFMAFLAGARAIEPLEPVMRAGRRFERYQFQVDGPAFAQAIQAQLERQMREAGELPPGARLGLPEQYAQMQGSGEIWLDARGLPARQELRLSFPPGPDGRVEARIAVNFSRFAGPPGGRPFAPERLLPLGRQLLAGLALGLAALGAGLLMLRYGRSRGLHRAIVALTIGSLIATPQLQGASAAASGERQAARAAEQQRQQELAEAQRAVLASQAPPPAAHAAALAAIRGDAGSDSDRDGRTDVQEALLRSNPTAPDPAPPAQLSPGPGDTADSDRDGITDYEEALLGTSSSPRDRDRDGTPDGQDSDRDRIPDPIEIAGYSEQGGARRHLDPLAPDSNGDQIDDGREWGFDGQGRRLASPQDSDGDGTSDLFDDDNDGDGVYDWLDLSPFSRGTAVFSRANPLSLSVQGLITDTTALIELQLRPTDPRHLWYAFNVLNWPENDTEGQVQDLDGRTFADVDASARRPADANGDMKLVPMLEVTVYGGQANLATRDGRVDQELYDRYGIAVRPLGSDGGSLIYVPLHLVTDPRSGEQAGFYGKMLYRAGGAWGQAHQFRMVWMVQALVDQNCYPDPDTSAMRCDAYNQQQVIHSYYDDWTITALNVREDHGVQMALITDRPELAPGAGSDLGLLLLARGLERTFLSGRDCDSLRGGACAGDGALDFSVAEIARRFDRAGNDGVPEAERWNLPDMFEVRTRSYADLDAALFDATRPDTVATLLPGTRQEASILFARDERFRSLNLDEQTAPSQTLSWSERSLRLDLSGRPIEQLAGLSIAPYRRSGGRWLARPVDQQITAMEAGLQSFYSQAAAAGAMSRDEARGRAALAKAYYLALRTGSAERVLLDGEPLYSISGVADVAVYAALPNTALSVVMNFSNSVLQVAMDAEKVFQVSSQAGLQSQILEGLRLVFDDMELSPYDFVRKAVGVDFLKSGFDILSGGAVLSTMFLGVGAMLIGTITNIVGTATGDLAAARAGALTVQVASIVMTTYFQVIKPVLQVVAAVYNLVKESGETLVDAVGMVLAGTSNIIGSNIIASIIGLIFQVAIVWGMALVQALVSGAAVGSLQLSLIISSAIASTILAVLSFALSLTVVGTILVGLISLVDALLSILCQSNITGACWGISDFVAKQLTRYFFEYQPLIGLRASDLIRPERLDVQLQDPQLGLQAGNRAALRAVIATRAQHVLPEAGASGALLFNANQFLTEANLRSTNFAHQLQSGTELLPPPGPSAGTGWQELSSFSVSYRLYALLAIPVDRTSTLHSGVMRSSLLAPDAVTLQAGINRSLSARLASSYNVPAAECWGIGWASFCKDQRLTGSLPTAALGVKLDVFPASLDELYAGAWDPRARAPLDRDGDGLRGGPGGDPDDSRWDSDGDGLSDGFELSSSSRGMPSLALKADTDDDGLSDRQEQRAGSSSLMPDTDLDGLSDAAELAGWIFSYGPGRQALVTSNPTRADSDSDGISDLLEYQLHLADPAQAPFNPRVPNSSPSYRLNQELSDRDGIVGLGQTLTITSTLSADPEGSAERAGLGFAGAIQHSLPPGLGGGQLQAPINATPRRPGVVASSFTIPANATVTVRPYTVTSRATGQLYRAELSTSTRWEQWPTSELLLSPAQPGGTSWQIASSPAPAWPQPLLLAGIEGQYLDPSDPAAERGAGRIVVRQAGASVDAARRLLDDGSAPKHNRPPALACAANGACLVAWAEWRDGYDIYAALVRPGLQAGQPFALAAGAGDDILPAVASDGASFLVGWQRGGALYTRLVANSGAPGGEQRLDNRGGVTQAAAGLALAWAGDRYLAAWERRASAGDRDLWLAALDAGGAYLAGSEQGVALSGADERLPQLAYEPQSRRALLAYLAGEAIVGQLVEQGLAQAGRTTLAANAAAGGRSVAVRAGPDALNGGWTIAWPDPRGGLQAQSLDGDGRLRATPLLLQREATGALALSCLQSDCALLTTGGAQEQGSPRIQLGRLALRAQPEGQSTVAVEGGQFSFLLDGVGPQVQLTSHPASFYMRPDSTLIVGGTASDRTGVRLVELRLDDGPWQPANGAENWSYALSIPPGEGRRSLALRATDRADNSSAPAPTAVLIDGTPPQLTSALAQGTLITPTLSSAGYWPILLRGTVADPRLGDGSPGSGATAVEVLLSPNSGGWQPAEVLPDGRWQLTYRLGLNGDGETIADPTATYEVLVRARDAAGNQHEPAGYLRTSLRIDMRPPTPRVLFPAPRASSAIDGTQLITQSNALLTQTSVITGVIEDLGGASAGLDRAELTLLPAGSPIAPGSWRGLYRNGPPSGPPALVRDDAELDISWGDSPGPGVGADGFSVEWAREALVRVAGVYTISAETEPGGELALYLNGESQPRLFGGGVLSSSVSLEAGPLPLRLVYRHGTGEARLRLGFELKEAQSYLVDLAARGPGVDRATWAFNLPPNLEGIYQITMRAGDLNRNRSDLPGELVWRGEIDTAPPRLSLRTDYLGLASTAQTAYALSVSDLNLVEERVGGPCSLLQAERSYYDDDWWREWVQDPSRLYELRVTCRVPGHSDEQPVMEACDRYGNCATANERRPRPPGVRGLYWADSTRVGRLGIDSGATLEIALPPGGRPSGLAVDPQGEQVYWSGVDESGRLVLSRANLDGSAAALVYRDRPPAGAAQAPLTSLTLDRRRNAVVIGYPAQGGLGYSTISLSDGRLVDAASGTLFAPATDSSLLVIPEQGLLLLPGRLNDATVLYARRYFAGGADAGVISLGPASLRVLSLAYDPLAQQIYYVADNLATNAREVRRAPLILDDRLSPAERSVAVLSPGGAFSPQTVALDLTQQKLFVGDADGVVRRASLDGSGLEQIAQGILAQSLAFDVELQPRVGDMLVSTSSGAPVSFTLQARDPNGAGLRYFIEGPEVGTLSGAPGSDELLALPPTLTYTPPAGFSGSDQLRVRVEDGRSSAEGVISILVEPSERLDAAILAPADQTLIQEPGPLTLRGSAFAANGVQEVVLRVNGEPLATKPFAGETSVDWTESWTPPGEGSYALTAQARDLNGQLQADLVTTKVIVDFGEPRATLETQVVGAGGAAQAGSVVLTGTATDTQGVAQVSLIVNDEIQAVLDQGAGCTVCIWRASIPVIRNPALETPFITVRVVDVVGRVWVNEIGEILVDLVPPELGAARLTYAGAGGAEADVPPDGVIRDAQSASSPGLRLRWDEASDEGGVVRYYAQWSASPTPSLLGATAVEPGEPREHGLTLASAEGAAFYAHLAAEDQAGNLSWQTLGPVYVDAPVTPDRVDDVAYQGWLDSGATLMSVDARAVRAGSSVTDSQRLSLSWDAERLRLSWSGANWDQDGDLFVYVDSGPGGARTAYNPYSAPVTLSLPAHADGAFEADYLIEVEDSATARLRRWDGSAWQLEQSFPPAPSGGIAYRLDRSAAPPRTDLLLPFSALGIASPASGGMRLLAFASEEEALRLWAAAPAKNPLNSARALDAGSPLVRADRLNLSQFFAWSSLGPGQRPNEGQLRLSDFRLALSAAPGGSVVGFLGDGAAYLLAPGQRLDADLDGSPDIALPLAAGAPLGDGQVVSYTLSYRNAGSAPADLRLRLTAHGGLRLLDGSPTELTVPDVPAGGEGSLVIGGAISAAGGLRAAELSIVAWDETRRNEAGLESEAFEWLSAQQAIDRTPPAAPQIVPPQGPIGMLPYEVAGRAADDAGVGQITLEIQPLAGGAAQTLSCATEPSSARWRCAWAPPAGGEYRLRARATDRWGNVGPWGDPVTLTVDATPPSLVLDQETERLFQRTIALSELSVGGQASDDRRVQRVEICPLAGQGACIRTLVGDGGAAQGDWRALLSGVGDGGSQTLAFYAVDAAGNRSAAPLTRTLRLDSVAPQLAVTGSLPAVYLGSYWELAAPERSAAPAPAVLSGTVRDGDGVAALLIRVEQPDGTVRWESAEIAGDLWRYTPRLRLAGAYRLTPEAYDRAGNRGEGESRTLSVLPSADLALSFSAAPDGIRGDDPLSYTLLASNRGASPTGEVALMVTLPDGAQLAALPAGCSLNGRQLRCALGSLGVGARATLSFALRVPRTLQTLTLLATLSGREHDTAPANNQATATAARLAPGQQIYYSYLPLLRR